MFSLLNKLYKTTFKAKSKPYGWFGNYSTWIEAQQQCTGYDTINILEKVKNAILKVKNGEAAYERDSVLFDKIEYSKPLLNILQSITKENNNTLHILDFGGSLGSSYFQNKNLLTDIQELKWSVVEQKHFVDCGKKYIEDDQLKFYYTIEDALQNNKPHALLLSSIIQYFEKPYELIDKCLQYNFDHIIVDRTAFIKNDKERITIQIVPEFIYKASYPSWFLNEQKFINAFKTKYILLKDFDSKFDPTEKLDGLLTYRKGFFFKKTT